MTPEAAIRAVWMHGADDLHLLSRGRHAFGLAADAATLRGGEPVIWLPEFFLDDTLVPLRRRGVAMVFYPLRADLQPDWDACRALAARRRPDVFVLVHYGAHAGDAPAARDFCREHGALLFEDASHALQPSANIGQHGDLVLYSPRKFVALPDGGVLAVRGTELTAIMRRVAQSLPQDRVAVARWVFKHWRKTIKSAVLPSPPPRTPLPPTVMDEDSIPSPEMVPLWMSGYSRRRLARAVRSGEIEFLARQRRETYRALAARLSQEPDMTPIAPDGGAAATVTLVKCATEADAQRRLNQLRAYNARVFSWVTLPREVSADPDGHPMALHLRRSVLCFPHEYKPDGVPTDFLVNMPPAAAAMSPAA